MGRRGLATVLVMVVAAALLTPLAPVTPVSGASAAGPVGAGWVEEDLGTPITNFGSAASGYTVDDDGRNIAVFTSSGEPSVFSAVDIETGERLFQSDIPGWGVQIWQYATVPNGDVYFATTKTGELYRFDPNTLQLELVGPLPFGQTHAFGITAGDDGTVFVGAYPGGRVISYEPGTGEWRDYGNIRTESIYVRGIDSAGGTVYAGLGTMPGLFHIDIETGATEEIPLPDGYADSTFVNDVSVRGDYLFARMTPSADLLVYSVSQQSWIDTIPKAAGADLSPVVTTTDSGVTRRETLIPMQGTDPLAFDIDTGETRPVAFGFEGASKRWGVAHLTQAGFPGTSLVTARPDGAVQAWNTETGTAATFDTDPAPSRFPIRSLGVGPVGDIWAGGYSTPKAISRIDADTGESQLFPYRTGQPEEIVAHGKWLIAGIYTRAWIYPYDTTKPWDWGTNPRAITDIGHDQDRPVALASAGDVVAVGTMPGYGKLGGALSLVNPETREVEVFRNVVPDQTVLSLTYHDGLIYGGTGIWGGIGIEPTTTEGHLFIFDPATDEVVYSGVPVPGAQNVSALTFDDEGNLWGFTANELFKFDPRTREVVLTKKYFDVDDSAIYATGRELFWHDGKLVGASVDRLFEIDPATLEMTVLQDDISLLAIDRNGSYYYARGSSLFRMVRADQGPSCDVTLTGRHEQAVVADEGTVCLTDADVRGTVTVSGGATLVVTGSTLRGSLAASGAEAVVLRNSDFRGSAAIHDTTGKLTISDSTIHGSLSCEGNASLPDDEGHPNTVRGSATGQCAGL